MKEGDMVLRQVVASTRMGKLLPNWEGPYRIKEKLPQGAYKLEEMDGTQILRTWNVVHLR